MKRTIFFPVWIAFLFIWMSCADEHTTEIVTPASVTRVSQLALKIGDMTLGNEGVETRAVAGFSVNTNADPTHAARTTGWELYVKIYDNQQGNALYGQTACSYSGNDYWIPDNALYFPNYLRQEAEAQLYPAGWTAGTAIVKDQSASATLVLQDILIQHHSADASGDRAIVFPSHIPSISMEHMYSMLDVVLKYVEQGDIEPGSVKVLVGADTYIPYQVPGKMEYLVILPVGTVNPKITLTTTGGIRYEEEILINKVHADGTHRNYCYYATLEGIELLLSSVTVTDWVYGEALAGQYTTIASNPTFYGPIDGSVTLIYRNGLEQTIYFNRWGEATIQPSGRTILQLRKSDNTVITLNPPITLEDMNIDLNPYLD